MVDATEMPWSLRRVRAAKSLGGTVKAWWYVNEDGIDIFGQHPNGGTTAAHLTREQLERALEVMDEVRESA